MFAINAKAAFFCMQEAAKRMAENGRIINMETSLVGAPCNLYKYSKENKLRGAQVHALPLHDGSFSDMKHKSVNIIR
jgi:hypothetical protein